MLWSASPTWGLPNPLCGDRFRFVPHQLAILMKWQVAGRARVTFRRVVKTTPAASHRRVTVSTMLIRLDLRTVMRVLCHGGSLTPAEARSGCQNRAERDQSTYPVRVGRDDTQAGYLRQQRQRAEGGR